MAGAEIAWQPDAAICAASNLAAFMRALGVETYDELLARADREPAWFVVSTERPSGESAAGMPSPSRTAGEPSVWRR